MKNTEKTMEKIVALCKGRGFVYPGSDIYGGLANSWDYGPLGSLMKQNVKAAIKQDLEALVGVVPGLTEVTVHIDGRLATSNADLMLDSTLESEEALKAYAVHPAHVKVAEERVKPYSVQRVCLDFAI